MAALTQRMVDGLPSDRDGTTWDDAVTGLGLRVQAGKRTWIVRYRAGGAQRQKSLPGALPLKKAREQAAEIIAASRRGTDVVAEGRDAARARRRAERDGRRRSVKAIAAAYLDDPETKKLAPRTVVELKRYLNEVWQPLHGHDAEGLDRRTVVARLEEIRSERGPIASNRAKSYLSMALSFGAARGLLDRNPVIGIKAIAKESDRERVLNDAELRTVWHAVDPATDYGQIVRLLILLGQRRGEVGGIAWPEVDGDLWLLPGERTKNGLAHEVPLPSQALAILAALKRKRKKDRDLVFGAGEGPFSGWSQAKDRLDAAIACRRAEDGLGRPLTAGEPPAAADALPPWTLHDLRRTVDTGMNEIGVAPHIVEAVINHISGHKAGVAGVYNRAKYRNEKRAALQRWADHVERIVAGEPRRNAVAFGR